jgi:hypothetical protein
MANENDYKKANEFLINTLGLTKEMSCKDVKKKIYAYLKKQYSGKVSAAQIKMHTDDFTESICLELNINQD